MTEKTIKRTLELTEFDWEILRKAAQEYASDLSDKSRHSSGRVAGAAERYGCRLYCQALSRALKQIPKAEPFDK